MSFRPARILVLRGGALGDFIVTLPALRALRDRWPDGRIALMGYPRVAELARLGGLVDEVHSLDRAGVARFFAAHSMFSEEQAEFIRSFDVILNYLHDPDGALDGNLRRAGARVLIHGSPLVTDGHAADHFLRPLQALAIYDADTVPRLVERAATAAGSGRVIIHPGSGSPRKNWPLERFLAVAGRARAGGCEVSFLLGEVERDWAAVVAGAGFPVAVERPLSEVVSRLAAAGGYLGNDSGVSHLAAACGCACVVIFGPTDPAQWGPRGRVRILRAADGELRGVAVEEVQAALAAVLGGGLR